MSKNLYPHVFLAQESKKAIYFSKKATQELSNIRNELNISDNSLKKSNYPASNSRRITNLQTLRIEHVI